jgi:serine/threonine-protein kinase RsbW
MHAESDAHDDMIELCLPVRAELLVLARYTAATVAARAGFDIEEIEDLRLAVEELCLSLASAGESGNFHLQFLDVNGTVEITCVLEGASDSVHHGASDAMSELHTDGLSDRILDALVDEHGYGKRGDSDCAWLRKTRAGLRD